MLARENYLKNLKKKELSKNSKRPSSGNKPKRAILYKINPLLFKKKLLIK